jgi:RNA polymerase sigma-70 factor (ECF subfamily)
VRLDRVKIASDTQQASKRFRELVWPELQLVLRAAQLLSGNAADAEDLAQETMLKAFAAMDRFQPGSAVRPWLLTILRRTWIDRWRSQKGAAAEVSLESLGEDLAAGPVSETAPESYKCIAEMIEQFSDQEVIAALAGLPMEIRWTLLLVDVQELSLEESAGILDVPLGTVKSRAHRGRAMLRQTLLPLARSRRWVSGQ